PEGHMASNIARRKFLATLGGAVAAWPLAAGAPPQGPGPRAGGALKNTAGEAPAQSRLEAVLPRVQPPGGAAGRNLHTDARWAAADAGLFRRYATELVALAPDVIVASTNNAVAPLQQATRTVPIVFAVTIDPVGSGFVASLARPGGNATGFLLYEYSISGKWLELLKQIAPGVTRAAVLRDPAT